MRWVWTAFGAGLLFGAGLVVSGMTQADKVIAFLDVTDAWDPSLAFVMIGAIAVHGALFRWIVRRPSPLFAARFALPTRSEIDGRLVGGAALFGVGWAIGGYCPGPGITSLVSGSAHTVVFGIGLVAGMGAFHLWDQRATSTASAERKAA